MAYWQWGTPDSSHVVVCVHGLSRQGRDFDVLARTLAARAADHSGGIRIVCPDVAGRGESDWLKDPMGYQVPAYAADMLALISQLHHQASISRLDWVGTSMGGLIGMVVCGAPGMPLPVPVRKLVLNDVGPALQWAAISRIGEYLGKAGQFATVDEAAAALRVISSGFGPHTDEEWLALCRPMLRPVEAADGRLRLHYDPDIALIFKQATEASTAQGETQLWELYDNISAQTLLLRGEQSDLLSPQTAAEMTRRGPRAQLVELEGVGHAPTLVAGDQVKAVADFLLD